MGVMKFYYDSKANTAKEKADAYEAANGELSNASEKVDLLKDTLNKCVDSLKENFIINTKVGDGNLTEEGVNSLDSLSSSIASVMAQVSAKQKEFNEEAAYWRSLAKNCKDDEAEDKKGK